MRTRHLAALLLAAAGFCTSAHAQVAGALRGGSTGFGADLGYSFTDQVGIRGAWHGGSITRDYNESGVRYEGKWDFSTAMALVDFHPGSGSFRLSAGIAYNGNKLVGTARGTSGTIEINGNTYNIADVGTINGTVGFNRTNPYFGVGWGSASRTHGPGLFFSADIGALFVKPRATLSASCGSALSPAQCSQFQSDLRAEEQDIEDGFGYRKLYPVLSFGIGYRF
jgi:hypothetical protein